VDKILNIA
jgi:hypothetical protein